MKGKTVAALAALAVICCAAMPMLWNAGTRHAYIFASPPFAEGGGQFQNLEPDNSRHTEDVNAIERGAPGYGGGFGPDGGGKACPAEAASVSGRKESPEAAPSGGPPYLFTAIGDSLTRGVGDETKSGGYVGYVQARLSRLHEAPEVQTVNLGKSGLNSGQLLERLASGEAAEALGGASWIAVSIGGNDLLKIIGDHILNLTYEPFRGELELFGQRTREAMRLIRGYNSEAPVFVLGLFNPFRGFFADLPEAERILEDWNGVLREAAECGDAVFVPIADLFAGREAELVSDDGLHPNGSGYALIGERIFSRIVPMREAAAGAGAGGQT